LTIGNTIPAAPASRAGLTSHGRVCGTRTHGLTGVPAVAAIMAWAWSMGIGPCSISIMSQSNPAPASSCVTVGPGMATPTP